MVSASVWQPQMEEECWPLVVQKEERDLPFLTNQVTRGKKPLIKYLKAGLHLPFLLFIKPLIKNFLHL